MLLSFSCDNFKSFQDGFLFNMIPEKRMTDLKYSILSEKINHQEEKALSASVIYGPNASGKSSVINAMSCLRSILLRGNIRDALDDRAGDHVSSNMILVPFAFNEHTKPVRFDIVFTYHQTKFRYVLSVYLGDFLNPEKNRYIEQEQLYINDYMIFDRTKEAVNKLNLNVVADYLNIGYKMENVWETRELMSNNISPDNLLLVTDFYSFCSKKIVEDIRQWFERSFIVINSADRAMFLPSIPENQNQALINEYFNKIAQEAGIIGSDFAYFNDPESHTTKIISVIKKSNNQLFGIDSDKIESVGTLRLISIMPVIISALRRGAVLVADELDASLHPMIIMNIISIFHNDDVNQNGAQIIFNTHNPIYLNHSLLRRDEIKFVERDHQTKSSSLYSLSDFKANGETSVRKTSDYMKNYFVSRYGAIEDIDFTDIITDALKEANDFE